MDILNLLFFGPEIMVVQYKAVYNLLTGTSKLRFNPTVIQAVNPLSVNHTANIHIDAILSLFKQRNIRNITKTI